METKELTYRERRLIEDPAGMALHDSLSWSCIHTLEAECEILGMLSADQRAYLGERILTTRESFSDAIARYIRIGMEAKRVADTNSAEQFLQ